MRRPTLFWIIQILCTKVHIFVASGQHYFRLPTLLWRVERAGQRELPSYRSSALFSRERQNLPATIKRSQHCKVGQQKAEPSLFPLSSNPKHEMVDASNEDAKMMRSARLHDAHDLRIEQVPRPTLLPGHILIAPKFCGICGSDLHFFHHPALAASLKEAHPLTGAKLPLPFGHEFSGVVCEIGDGCAGHVKASLGM